MECHHIAKPVDVVRHNIEHQTMARILLLTALIFCKLSYGQTQGGDSLLIYTGVATVDSSTQKELALRARQWFSDNFKNPKDVLQVNDIENGELSGNGSFRYSATLKAYGVTQATAGFITVKISVWTKDNKFKFEIGPFSVETMQSSYGGSNNNSFYISKSDTHPSIALVKMNNKTKAGLNEWWTEMKNQCDAEAKSLIQSLQKAMQIPYKGNW
jgi:hypothetical protein